MSQLLALKTLLD